MRACEERAPPLACLGRFACGLTCACAQARAPPSPTLSPPPSPPLSTTPLSSPASSAPLTPTKGETTPRPSQNKQSANLRSSRPLGIDSSIASSVTVVTNTSRCNICHRLFPDLVVTKDRGSLCSECVGTHFQSHEQLIAVLREESRKPEHRRSDRGRWQGVLSAENIVL